MDRRTFIKLTGTGLASVGIGGCSELDKLSNSQRRRPNIVLILADDMGFSDAGCYGGEIDTPHIDNLAQDGIRFSRFYNAARCCPTRAGILTGLYPHQAGVGHMTGDAGFKGYRGNLSKNALTLAEVLKLAGYHTMMCGKWHVTRNTDGQDKSHWPLQRGFDKFFGTLHGACSYWDPKELIRDNEFISPGSDFFYTDALADHAVTYIDQACRNEAPFFLYTAFTAPHYPLHARKKTIDKYQNVYDVGWEEIRKQRVKRLKKLGLIDEKLEPRLLDEASKPWTQVEHKSWQAHRMQVYAAMVDEMDQAIGRIINTLRKNHQLDNTLLVFLSDNGGSPEGHLYNTIERTGRPWKSRLIPETTPDGKKVISGDWPGLNLGPADTYGSYGLDWASVSNTPFRRHKSWVHEGGISTPCIIHWPKGLHARNQLVHNPAHIIDLMPTFIDVAQASYPPEFKGHNITPLPGKSLVPLLQGRDFYHDYLCWEHEGNRAIRKDNWKMVSEYPGSWKTFYHYPKNGQWELYDIENDRLETNDLAQKFPETVSQLQHLYNHWAQSCDVIPWETIKNASK